MNNEPAKIPPELAAYKLGADAYQKREKENVNPYPRRSKEWFAWLRGWNTARFGESLSVR